MLIGLACLHYVSFLLQTNFEKEFQKRIASEFDLNTVISPSLLAEALFLVFADGRKEPLPWIKNDYIDHAPA